MQEVDYRWKGGASQGIEIASKQMAQFIFHGAKTFTKASTNSKGGQSAAFLGSVQPLEVSCRQRVGRAFSELD